ncbi:MAG: hypothetical protein LC102_12170 [Ignavibacteriales bacterium]|nr:MAG: hypothetical protein F9K26_11135 [Ignavibacteriaceae bacterium]MBW7873829.1 hypothetical protein [Ignavibacteria bacterium]MCZ2144166.1 hypothetical protein [Ignavibacteriales bacterium]OQY77587.1 MAG: hypothetical protein B6D45_02635 [Ignavibacteriales bacterium UTCHB3]MBV6445805.1 hypothetical protein [Ignavibacteriaceae bacterium]
MKDVNKNRLFLIVGMILLAAIMRIVPHVPNFTPIAAMALFGGAYLTNKKLAFAIPMIAMFLSDLVIGFHSTMWGVYIAFAIVVGIGMLLRENNSVLKTVGAAVVSSVVFFVLSNFAVWASTGMYTPDFNGLTQCYVAAIPFYQYSVLGDLLYTAVMFGAFEFARVKVPALSKI